MTEQIVVETPKGKLFVYTSASSDEIGRLTLDPQFSEHSGFRSIYTRRESLMRRAAEDDSRVVLAVTDRANIIGFLVLAHPEPEERWSRLGPKVMMEVNGIEVTRDWRRLGIGKVLLQAMLSHPNVEDRIIYLVGYTWTWDLEGTNMPASQYRKMMIRLFQPFQFDEWITNEPNISLDPDNLFMCRIGKNISDKLRDDLKWLSFGVAPQ